MWLKVDAFILRDAIRHLHVARLRTALAVLGITIGTAAVVTLLTCGYLASQASMARFNRLGTRLLSVSVGQSDRSPVDMSQIQKMRHQLQQLVGVQVVAPLAYLFLPVRVGGHGLDTQLLGVTPAFQAIAHLHARSGRLLHVVDDGQPVCVMGADLAKQLKRQGLWWPLQHQALIQGRFWRIVGVLAPWQESLFVGANLNRSILVPLSQTVTLSDHVQVRDWLFELRSGVSLQSLKSDITARIRLYHRGARLFFRSPEQIVSQMKAEMRSTMWLLAAMGGVSLLVGGIGIMNIMLVTVMERRREIGLRMAIGATPLEIRSLFCLEAIGVSALGGLLGVLLGVLASALVAWLAHWAWAWWLWPWFLGLMVAIVVGLFFGWYPAHKASGLSPAQALLVD